MIPPQVAHQPAQTKADSAVNILDLLAAVIATDSRATAIFADSGDLLLANAVAGAAKVAQWHRFGRSADWAGARDEAQARGSCSVSPSDEETADLHVIPAETGLARYYLMRVTSGTLSAEDRSLSERITDMAHDLRAPLQSLIIAADGLKDARTQDGREAELGALAQLAIDQVANLLETVRMDGVSADTEPRVDFDLIAVVRETVRLLDPICRRSNNFILAELPEGEAWHSGGPHLLRAVLQNLITNANRFNMNGPITVRLKIAATEGSFESLVTLEVEDVGPGFTEAERKLVLSPGTAGRPLQPGSKDGYGLGLGIVSRAVSRLRGRIELGQGKERGALFRITFPLTGARARDDQRGDQIPDRPEFISLAGLRILVVEDNPVNLAILLRTLTDAGAEVEGVVNGMDALLRVRSKKDQIDVVLLDVTLPDIDGIEVARQIRSEESAGQHLLIVGLTAHVGSVIHGSGLAAGMDHILIKPVRPSELRLALRDAKEGTRPRQQAINRMQTPETMLNNALVLELTAEMGRPATLVFMQRALEEAREVFDLARSPEIPENLRARIHSAIGSAGLTGLAGVEYALRRLQIDARVGLCDAATLDLAEEMAHSTEVRLQQYAAES
ncbi:hybrid sensor histidine kinase/response regulator [Pseudomonas sp. GX19020]|uniref:hybrid sensor histidine kinase/response regulator n=1 Tax=Pseudomonas sp. GX19020 TaxID=2942277 RepID=UPI002018B3C5|nr:hybrid sensor histidine kinase/response regulator [Pseudomonas sp. GX19020]